MKIKEFLNNPVGKGAIVPGKDIILTNLDYRLEVLLKYKKININIYTQELADAEKFLQSYNTEYNRLSVEIESNKDELAYGSAAGTLT